MATPKDRMWLGPELPDGNHRYVRQTESGAEIGIAGNNIPNPDGSVELKPVGRACYEVLREVRLTASGPVQVASRAYREGWDTIFGAKATVGQA